MRVRLGTPMHVYANAAVTSAQATTLGTKYDLITLGGPADVSGFQAAVIAAGAQLGWYNKGAGGANGFVEPWYAHGAGGARLGPNAFSVYSMQMDNAAQGVVAGTTYNGWKAYHAAQVKTASGTVGAAFTAPFIDSLGSDFSRVVGGVAAVKPGTSTQYTSAEWAAVIWQIVPAIRAKFTTAFKMIVNGTDRSNQAQWPKADVLMNEAWLGAIGTPLGNHASWMTNIQLAIDVAAAGVQPWFYIKMTNALWATATRAQARRYGVASYFISVDPAAPALFENGPSEGGPPPQTSLEYNDPIYGIDLGTPTETFATPNGYAKGTTVPGNAGIYGRYFTKGIALVNTDTAPHTYTLTGTGWKDITGATLGSTTVTVAPQDGVLFLGPTPVATAPAVLPVSPLNITKTTVTLRGSVDPNSLATTWHFEYGPTAAYGTSTTPQTTGATPDPITVSAALTGLTAGQTLHYRLVATSSGGAAQTPDQTLVMVANTVPTLTLAAVTALGQDTVALHGTVNPNSLATTWWFEYGEDTTYGQVTPTLTAGSGSSAVAETATLTGLTPGTVYHYRLAATNAGGTTRTVDATFTTPGAPVPTLDPVVTPTQTTAILAGTIDTRGAQTSYHFEYGPTSVYGSSTPVQTITGPKDPPQGLYQSQVQAITAGYEGSFDGVVLYLTWRELETANSGGALNGAGLAKITAVQNYCAANGKNYVIRLFTNGSYAGDDTGAPAWVKSDGAIGLFRHLNSQDDNPYTQAAYQLCRYWTPRWKTLYTRFANALGALVDSDPFLSGVTVSMAMMKYAEPLILDVGGVSTNPGNPLQTFDTGLANRHELVGGGNGFGTGNPATTSPVNITGTGAGFTDALHNQAVRDGMSVHAAAFPTTPQTFAFNPYQTINADATFSVDTTALTKTLPLINFFAATLGSRAVMESNSGSPDYFVYDVAGNPTGYATGVYPSMYQAMVASGAPVWIQTQNNVQIVTTQFPTVLAAANAVEAAVARIVGANSGEPVNTFASVATPAQVKAWRDELNTNLPPPTLVDVFANISGLAPGTTYHYALIANGTQSADGVFATPGVTAITFSYLWQTSSDGVTWATASGALPSAKNYTIGQGDLGLLLRCRVTATNGQGQSTILATTPIGPVIAVGSTAFIFDYLWQNSADQVHWGNASGVGASSRIYTVDPTDAGLFLRCQVTAIGTAGASLAVSNTIGPVFVPTAGQLESHDTIQVTVSPGGSTLEAHDSIHLVVTEAGGQPPFADPSLIGTKIPAWLRLDGVELANWARTSEYLGRGLAGGALSLKEPCGCGYLYRVDGAQHVFRSPAQDPAPWWDPQRPESSQFLGIVVNNLQHEPVTSHTTADLVGPFGGTVLSPRQTIGRRIVVSATLVASSCSGRDYGIEWLNGQLGNPSDDSCDLATLEFREVCPPADGSYDDMGYWLAYRAGITSGPTMTPGDNLCNLTDVTWTWTSEVGYLYKAPERVIGSTVLAPPDTATTCMDFVDWFCGAGGGLQCATIIPPTSGVWDAIVTIFSPDGVGGIDIATYSRCPPDLTVDVPEHQMRVTGLQGTLIIDSALEMITYISLDNTEVMDGTRFIDVPTGEQLEWIEVTADDQAKCVCFSQSHPCSGGEQTTVTVDLQYRRR